MGTDTVTQQRAHPAAAALADVLLAAGVLFLGFLARGDGDSRAGVVVALGAALAAGGARRWPAAALAGIWVVALLQVAAAGPVLATTLGVTIVGFRCARYGSRSTLWAAGLSIPVGSVVALVLAEKRPQDVAQVAALATAFGRYGAGVVGGFLVLAAVLAVPFAAGLILRVNERYRRSRVARELAESQAAAEREIARSRAAQTTLARDVHDVVGHSLAVIIAQADSAQAGAQHADESVRTALAQIAAVGRSSLAEIRDVLNRTDDAAPGAPRDPVERDELSELVAGVRGAGNPVHETVTGDARPLTPDTATAAYRVLQELLTNALKHGADAGAPIGVARTWTPDGLTLHVENPTRDAQPAAEGMGLTGVRARLAGVGGTLRTAVAGGQRDEPRFVATAFLPVAPTAAP